MNREISRMSVFSSLRFSAVFLLASALLTTSSASAISIDAFSVFGANEVMIGAGSTVETGFVGSYTEVRANGGATVNEDIHSGGTINFANGVAVILGSTYSSGNFTMGASGGRPEGGVGGSIHAGGNVQIGPGNTIGGSVVHNPGATVNINASTNVVGGVVSGVPTAPSLPTLPTATVFASGGANVNSGGILTPGSYGALNLGTGQALTLTAGNYYFDTWDTGAGLDMLLDFTGGAINLFVSGITRFGNNNELTLLNGGASDFFLEGHSEIRIGGGSIFYGIVYAPFDRIHIGGSGCCTSMTGSLWSGTVVDIEHGVTVGLSPDDIVVPEPSTWMLLTLGLFTAIYAARRKKVALRA